MSHSKFPVRLRRGATTTAALVVALTISLAGCSGGSAADPTSTAAPTDASGLETAEAVLEAQSVVPTEIPITEPLSAVPPKGKSVFFITPATGDYQKWTAGFEEAATVLGWTPTISTYPSNPADGNALVQQAVRQGADYIAVGGAIFPTNDPMTEAAQAAGVPLFYFSTDREAEGESNWTFASVGAVDEYVERGRTAASQAIAASDGDPHALLFNIPQFQAFKVYAEAFAEEYSTLCPDCTLEEIEAPVSDVFDGKATSSIVAFLRSHPDVDQVHCISSTVCQDLPAKAADAGITIADDGVLLTVGGVGDAQIDWFADGVAVTGQGVPYPYVGWQLIDAMARYSVGDSLEANWDATLPIFVHTAENTPAGSEPYDGPIGFREQFEQLWGL